MIRLNTRINGESEVGVEVVKLLKTKVVGEIRWPFKEEVLNPSMYTRKNKQAMDHVVDPGMSFGNIMKEVQRFGNNTLSFLSCSTFDNKALENQKVTELGGKPQKKQRLPLSVARFGGTNTKKPVEKKRNPEERVLGGILDVKDLLRSGGSSSSGEDYNFGKNKSKSKGMGGDLGGGGGDIKKK
ncbi:unnamed protein product [Eruca vesicaria subsp. sativa]|uniref:Uncharacterized protein n=1 Tax=Eruca vesicaria subsp. sativa TaxID=29727 RepID=A0ABC8JCL2_ERUVS|nr:unnamed protein product [Eruca vesicaria subsp. sativa]